MLDEKEKVAGISVTLIEGLRPPEDGAMAMGILECEIWPA